MIGDGEEVVRPAKFLGPLVFDENRPGLAAVWRFLGRFFGPRWRARGVQAVSFEEKARRIIESVAEEPEG